MGVSNHHVVIAVAPQAFTAWKGLAHLVQNALKYMAHRITQIHCDY